MPTHPIEAPLLGDGATRGVCKKLARVRKRTAKREIPLILAAYVQESGQSADVGSWIVRAWAASWAMGGAFGPSAPAQPLPPPAPAVPPPAPVPPPPGAVSSPMPPRPRKRHAMRGFLVMLMIGAAIWGTLVVLRKTQSPQSTRPSPIPRTAAPKPSVSTLPRAPSSPAPESLSSVRITVSRAGTTFNGTTLSHSQLDAALRRVAQANDKCPVEIFFGRDVDPRVLEDIKTRCRESGLRKLYVTKCDIE